MMLLERLRGASGETASGRFARLSLLVLAVLLAWQLGRLAWLLPLGQPSPDLPEPPPAGVVELPANLNPARIGQVFGEQPANATPAPGAVTDTTLQLRLDGVMASDDPDLARAFIAERSATGKVLPYRPGDTLPGNARLASVFPDRVLIDHAGRRETLRFDKPGMPPVAPPAGAPATAEQTRNALGGVAQGLAESPQAAIRQMGLRRTSQGYIVSITAPKDMMQRFGLQPGDRIVSINGQALGRDLNADQQVVSQLQQASSARVEVQRGEQTLTLEQRL